MSKKFKMGFGIGSKISTLIGLLLLVSTASVVFLATRLFIEDNTALIQQMNADSASSTALQTREYFENQSKRSQLIGRRLWQQGTANSSPETELLGNDIFYVGIYSSTTNQVVNQLAGGSVSKLLQGEPNWLKEKLAQGGNFSLQQVAQGEAQITTLNAEGEFFLAVGVPFVKQESGFSHFLVSVYDLKPLLNTVSDDDLSTRYMVDRRGNLIAHPEASRIAQNVSALGIVQEFLRGQFNNGQIRYEVPDTQEPMLGAFRSVGFAGLGVVTEIPEAKAFEAAKRVEYRSLLVGVLILCLALAVGYLFSESLTSPIYALVGAANQIASGDFNLALKPKTKDEVGYLSLAFNDMAAGLAERERLRDTFNKFHSEEIAAKILSGEVKLGGERMDATIFFSDIRGFTSLSESLAPEKVVELLNEYMEAMVGVIQQFKGVVDKYVGDAIMATWGVPLCGDQDTARAVSASLAMRQALSQLNERRKGRNEPPLYMGMGLNVGPVTAGNIGSESRMEYTVIGDSVNTASRIESMTKTFGTDLLISKSVYERVHTMFVCEACGGASVKGKTDAIQVYKVKGYYDQNRNPVLVETPYSSYAAEASDKVKAPPTSTQAA
ncbi:MAG: HAMP domain-containing protein [Bdellovibrionales bacterium]|nr:HAMP domain-containing protein [Bdellovibrionales bacterium]